MTESHGDPDTSRELAEARLPQVRSIACAITPSLSGLAHFVRIRFDTGYEIAAIGASGLLVLNPHIFATGDLIDLAFVFSHELMHLALDSHGRGVGFPPELVNLAHDMIINSMLVEDFGLQQSPFDGFHAQPEMRDWPLERLIRYLQKNDPREQSGNLFSRNWGRTEKKSGKEKAGRPHDGKGAAGILKEAFDLAGIPMPETGSNGTEAGESGKLPEQDGRGSGDLLTAEEESAIEGKRDREELARLAEEVKRLAQEANELEALRGISTGRKAIGLEKGNGAWSVEALRAASKPPWQMALQRWVDQAEPGRRTYGRPSRKAGDRQDPVLPGRIHDGWTLNILLDTSGSMTGSIPKILGMIAYFCEGAGVGLVRLIQCDAAVGEDRWLQPSELSSFTIHGGGGSDMRPAMEQLAREPGVRSVLVITDGEILYPENPPPFMVLWALVDAYDLFQPEYGTVVCCD